MEFDPTTLILKAIEDSAYEWRTPSGIAQHLKLPIETVASILESNPQFIRSSVPNEKGEPLYSTRKHRSWASRFWSAAANTSSS
jgi:hypothetical protein